MDLERCFCVLHSRFEISRLENIRLEKEDGLIVSEVCVTLHNLLIRMGEKRAFNGEVERGDILIDLYEEEREKLVQSTLEGNARKIADQESVTDTVEPEAEGIMIGDLGFTSQPCSRGL